MKILNNIGCALNSIEFNSIQQLNSNWIYIKKEMQIDGEDIVSLLAKCDVGKKLLKATNPIEQLCIHFYLAMG